MLSEPDPTRLMGSQSHGTTDNFVTAKGNDPKPTPNNIGSNSETNHDEEASDAAIIEEFEEDLKKVKADCERAHDEVEKAKQAHIEETEAMIQKHREEKTLDDEAIQQQIKDMEDAHKKDMADKNTLTEALELEIEDLKKDIEDMRESPAQAATKPKRRRTAKKTSKKEDVKKKSTFPSFAQIGAILNKNSGIHPLPPAKQKPKLVSTSRPPTTNTKQPTQAGQKG